MDNVRTRIPRDRRTQNALRANMPPTSPSERKAINAIREELYSLGVPATKCGAVAARIWEVLSSVMPVGLPEDLFVRAAAGGHYALAGRMMAIWTGEASEDLRMIGPAIQSYAMRRRANKMPPKRGLVGIDVLSKA